MNSILMNGHNMQYIKEDLIEVQTAQPGQVGGSGGVVILVIVGRVGVVVGGVVDGVVVGVVSVALSIYNLCEL